MATNGTPDARKDDNGWKTVLRRTLKDQGVTIIPAFSLGRTQELLYEMNGIFERIQTAGRHESDEAGRRHR